MVLRKARPSTTHETVETPPARPRTEFRKYTSLAVAIDMLQNRQITLLIRVLTDQNPFAHSLRPMDMMRQGWLSSFRQASQQ